MVALAEGRRFARRRRLPHSTLFGGSRAAVKRAERQVHKLGAKLQVAESVSYLPLLLLPTSSQLLLLLRCPNRKEKLLI